MSKEIETLELIQKQKKTPTQQMVNNEKEKKTKEQDGIHIPLTSRRIYKQSQLDNW